MLKGLVERDPRFYPSKGRELHGKMRWIQICRGMDRGRERNMYMLRCSGGGTHTARRVVGTFEECLQQTKMVGEQQE